MKRVGLVRHLLPLGENLCINIRFPKRTPAFVLLEIVPGYDF